LYLFFCGVKLNIYVSWFQLAKLGIDVILISRTKAKLEAVAAEIGMNKRKYILYYYLAPVSYQSKSHRRNMEYAQLYFINIWDLNWISTDTV
jgi:hypothetical protein